ncbi:hypothetical protein [Sunxiuqinia sp. sy24]|uniref:hypothetical protein n=1 Tax=Sunxiuqinia sp. sy24 TaxID=3461495 RepID=UPI0040461BE7
MGFPIGYKLFCLTTMVGLFIFGGFFSLFLWLKRRSYFPFLCSGNLLTVRGVTPARKGLTPYGMKTQIPQGKPYGMKTQIPQGKPYGMKT